MIDELSRVGGTENQLSALVRNLDPSKFETELIVLRAKPILKIGKFENFGCRVTYLGVPKLLSLKGLKAIFRVALKIRRDKVRIVQTFFIDANIFRTGAGRDEEHYSACGLRARLCAGREVV